MIIKKIPYGYHEVNQDDIDMVVEVLKNSLLAQGSRVIQFEELININVKSNFSVAVNSATSALHLACLSLGLEKGDYLWTSPISFVSSANCGLFCGAQVDFVDIDLDTGLMSINQLRKKLFDARTKNKLPKIVIPVHLGGTSCNMKEIYELSKEFNFKIIEDASHALGGSYIKTKVGSCKYSDLTVFSFHPVKIITTGEGGMITTNSENLYQKLLLLRSHGVVKDQKFFKKNNKNPWHYEQQILGFNFRMSEINAALGLSQLARLKEIVIKRNQILDKYKKELEEFPVEFLKIDSNIISSVHLAIIKLSNKSEEFHKEVFKKLHAKNIAVQIHYQPIHLNPFYENMGFREGDFPNAESYSKNALSLPVYPSLTESDLNYTIATLKDILNEK